MFIINPAPGRKNPELGTCESVDVRFDDVLREKQKLGGIFSEMEVVGKNEQRLRIVAREALSAAGRSRSSLQAWSRMQVGRSVDDVHRHLRRMRPEDLELVADIDEQIGDLQRQIELLRSRRETTIKAAWQRAALIPLRELVDAIPEEHR